MRISVIIPVYNVERYIRQCLDSVLAQTRPADEIILVDDGSTDNSYQICSTYQQIDPRILLLHQENRGLSAAWQRGLESASGEYVMFLDSDDWLDPACLEQMTQGLDGADVVCCNRILEFGFQQVLLKEHVTPGIYHREAIETQVFSCLLSNGSYLGRGISPNRWGKLIRRELLNKNVHYCDPAITYGEDLNIMFPVMLDCDKLVVLADEKGLYRYRQNQASIARSYKREMFLQVQRLVQILLQVSQEKQQLSLLPQIKADYLSMFLEYLKNETVVRERKKVAREVLANYREMKEEMASIDMVPVSLKKSDRMAVSAMEKGSDNLLAAWMIAYTWSKVLLWGKDWKYRKQKQKEILMVGPDASVQGGMQTVVSQYRNWDGWAPWKLRYVPTYIEGNALRKMWFFFLRYTQILGICLRNNVALAHIHVSERGSFYRKALVLKICAMKKIPVVLHHHGAEFLQCYDEASPSRQKWTASILEQTQMNLVLGQWQKEQMEQRFPKAKFQVLYNAVPVPDQNPYALDATGILFAGRFGQRKGIYDLLRALEGCSLPPDVKLYLCGDGEVEQVRQQVQILGLSDRVAYLGWCDSEKLKQIRKDAMVYVLPSYHEGLPMALLEAMADGIPSIGGRVGAIPEVIWDGENGFQVTPGDILDLQEKIRAMVAGKTLRARISEQAHATVKEKFSMSVGMAKLMEIYKDVLA